MNGPQTSLHPEQIQRLRRVSRLARLMDTAIRIPGTSIRFGGDQIIGLVPGFGDLAGGAIGLYIVNEARKLGLPRRKIMRMVSNLGFDVVLGSVPLAGDVADVFFKAHRRNLNIILEHFGEADTDFGDKMRERPMKDVTPKRR